MEANKTFNCSILIPSCDAYADLWEPFFTLFFKFWPDCPFKIFLGSNTLSYNDARVTVLYSNHGKNWTNRTKEHLEMIETEYVLLCLEDFFMQSPISTPKILSAFDVLKLVNGIVMRLTPRPAPDKRLKQYLEIGLIDSGAPFRVSTQTAIWKRESMISLMREGESIWEFEDRGSRRSDVLGDKFYGVWRPLMTYKHHVVERGKWFRHEAEKFGSMNIGCDFKKRETMSRKEMFRFRMGKFIYYPFVNLPWKWRYYIEDSLRSLLGKKKRTI